MFGWQLSRSDKSSQAQNLLIATSHTIPRFYSAEEFAEILLQAGFAQVTFERMLFGVTAVHTAVK